MEKYSILEVAYNNYDNKSKLLPLGNMRTVIADFYANKVKSKYFTFIGLSDDIDLSFIKKVLYASDFMWPTVIGLCGIIVSVYHFISEGRADWFGVGMFHFDLVFALILFLCLFVSSYPFFIESFNANMQEVKIESSYLKRMVRLFSIFIVTSAVIVSILKFFNLIYLSVY
ncbi:hypothetical protein [Pectobacterium sp. B1J-3]|uniref:hypothetical protein n=1 Tax=Pectobacterium sp. B1J-3 TaxID=3385371 RepID=UPI00390670EB